MCHERVSIRAMKQRVCSLPDCLMETANWKTHELFSSNVTRLAQRIALKDSVNERQHPERAKVTSNKPWPSQQIRSTRLLRYRFLKVAQTTKRIHSVVVQRLYASGNVSVIIWTFCRPRTILILIDGIHAVQRYINEVIRTADIFFVANLDVIQFQNNNAQFHSARLTAAFLRQE